MLKKIVFLSLAFALLCPLTALANFYIGAGIGNTWQSADVDFEEVTGQITEISENSTGYKIFAGFKGQSFLGIEGGYRDLGEIKATSEGKTFRTDSKGWDVEAIGHLEIAILDLFAKAGAFFWESDAILSNQMESESGTSFLWGLGAGVSLGPVGIRLEWESMEVKSLKNLSMLSLGVTFGF